MKWFILFSTLFIFCHCGGSNALVGPDSGTGDQIPPNSNPLELNHRIDSSQFRTIDGTLNHEDNPLWGSTETPLARLSDPDYGDGISSMGRADGPNPREISNAVCQQGEIPPNDHQLSSFVFMWGQFVDHDIDLTPDGSGESVPILVPLGDPFFDPDGLGEALIPFKRSSYDEATGFNEANPREQINTVTTWIDGSQIYGSDSERAAWLRTGEGGRLKVSAGGLLPFNDGTQDNFPDESSDYFVAGDLRANEHAALAAMHTLWVREHNRLADEIAADHPNFDDEQIYQHARKWVGAYLQAITYQEFLPALLGKEGRLDAYAGYDPEVDPSILNEFSTAFFRMGHSMLPEQLLRLGPNFQEVPEGNLSLAEAFFEPTLLIIEGGIDSLLRGLAVQPMEEVDTRLVEEVRSFLFGAPGAGGLDLAALNLQRGRDHGLPDFNTLREALGLNPYASFTELTSDAELADRLSELYKDIDQLDPWIGALAEDHIAGTSVGETILVALQLQFQNLRDGDRFWYENDPFFNAQDLEKLRETRLSDIIERNTFIDHLPENVFRSTID